MELKDIGRLVWKINTWANDEELGEISEKLIDIDSKSKLPMYNVLLSKNVLFKLNSKQIVLLVDEYTGVDINDEFNVPIEIDQELTVTNVVMFSKAEAYLTQTITSHMVSKESVEMIKALSKYVSVDKYVNDLNDNELNTIKYSIKVLQKLNGSRNKYKQR